MPDSLASVGGAGGGGGGGFIHLASVAVDEYAEDLASANGQGQEFQGKGGQERERQERKRQERVRQEREGQERDMLLIGTEFSNLYTGQGQESLELNCDMSRYADPSPPQPSANGMY